MQAYSHTQSLVNKLQQEIAQCKKSFSYVPNLMAVLGAEEDAMYAGDCLSEYGDNLSQCVQICDEASKYLKSVENSDALD